MTKRSGLGVKRSMVMWRGLLALLLMALVMIAKPAPILAVEQEEPLVVGLHPSAPFVMREKGSDQWQGIGVDIWRHLAAGLGRSFHFEVIKDEEALLQAVQNGTVDIGLGALTLLSSTEERLDFSHAYFTSSLSIAVRHGNDEGSLEALGRLFSWTVIKAILMLFGGLVCVGGVVWVFEHRRNSADFDTSPVRGVGAGLWYAAVTFTTVGYGDKAPITPMGRIIALVWMFLSLFLIATFTGTISSALTVNTLQSAIEGPNDLPRVRVGVVKGSVAEEYLKDRGLGYNPYNDMGSALKDLVLSKIDALVGEKPVLHHRIAQSHGEDLTVMPDHFQWEAHAFALPPGSALRESLNRQLLKIMASDKREKIIKRYLGEY